MRRTTLVTLKARSQAFRMAMGVLHEGKATRKCSNCQREFFGEEDLCPNCDNEKKQRITACSICGVDCAPLFMMDGERKLELCVECFRQLTVAQTFGVRRDVSSELIRTLIIVAMASFVGYAVFSIMYMNNTFKGWLY